jgi:hypothetical protein
VWFDRPGGIAVTCLQAVPLTGVHLSGPAVCIGNIMSHLTWRREKVRSDRQSSFLQLSFLVLKVLGQFTKITLHKLLKAVLVISYIVLVTI